MAARKTRDKRPGPPTIPDAPFGGLNVFEISEAELNRLKNVPPGQVHLNFALALLPAALIILITLLTAEIRSDWIYYGYWIAFWLSSVQGLIALAQWWTTYDSMKSGSKSFAPISRKTRAF
jgi:hypothetical protein